MKILSISFILMLVFACQNKVKPLLTLEDVKKEYKNWTERDLMKKEVNNSFENIKEIFIDNSYFKEKKNIHFIDSVIIIPLETTDNSLISSVSKVIFQENLFYIYDKDIQNIFIFESNGKLKSKVGIAGRGPGEYWSIQDFCISKENDIYILDDDQNVILVYDKDANFKKKITLNQNFNKISYNGKNIILTTSHFTSPQASKTYRLIEMSTDGKIINKFFPYFSNEENAFWQTSDLGIDVTTNQTSIYYPYFSNHIYKLDHRGKITDGYIYKVQDYEMPPYLTLALRRKETFSQAFDIQRQFSKSYITNVIELENYICTYLSVSPCIVFTIYNKMTKSIQTINSLFVKRDTWQDLFGEGILFVGGMSDDVLIGWQTISGFKIIQEIAHESQISLGAFDPIISQMNEEDNPYLILIKIKSK